MGRLGGMIATLRLRPRLTRRDGVLTLVPFFLWGALFLIRPWVSTLECQQDPSACSPESLHWIDRAAFGPGTRQADDLSTLTQNVSGFLALGVPIVYVLLRMSQFTPAGAWVTIVTTTVLGLQATFMNGALNEIVRLIVQRPRPFVYMDPSGSAGIPMSYTSFYSGHTSFSALACMILFTNLMGLGATRKWLIPAGLIGMVLISATAVWRVQAGKHFVSDVVVGAFAGMTIALVTALIHRPRRPSAP